MASILKILCLLVILLATETAQGLKQAQLVSLPYYCGYQCETSFLARKHVINCHAINTPEDISCAKELLANFSAGLPETNIYVYLYDTNLDTLPEDFLATYNVSGIILSRCNMSGIPFRLLNVACPSLTSLTIFHSNIAIPTIPPEGFKKCNKMKVLNIEYTQIHEVSPRAFLGMPNLMQLLLKSNQIRRFQGFQGIDNLTQMDLSSNRISSIDKDAFKGFHKLTSVDLSYNKLTTLPEGVFDDLMSNKGAVVQFGDNPFYCNCSLKWLQDWFKALDGRPEFENEAPQCAGPIRGPLRTLSFCNETISQRSTEPVSPTGPRASKQVQLSMFKLRMNTLQKIANFVKSITKFLYYTP